MSRGTEAEYCWWKQMEAYFLRLLIKGAQQDRGHGIDDPQFDPSKTGVHLNADAWNKLAKIRIP
jgi:hypothetical protein